MALITRLSKSLASTKEIKKTRKMGEFKAYPLKSHTPLVVEVIVRSLLCLRVRVTRVHSPLAAPAPMKSLHVASSLLGTHSSQMSSLDPSHFLRWEKNKHPPNCLKEEGVWCEESGQEIGQV